MITDGLSEDKVYEFVYIVTPQFAKGRRRETRRPRPSGSPAADPATSRR